MLINYDLAYTSHDRLFSLYHSSSAGLVWSKCGIFFV